MARFIERKPDYASFAGIAVALAGIAGGLAVERGQWQDLTQLTALLIVFGGTLGAVMLSASPAELAGALRRLRLVFVDERRDERQIVQSVLKFAMAARRGGILSIDEECQRVEEPLLRKGLMLAVDGADTGEIRAMLELDRRLELERAEADASVLEQAGGYAPTIGIIGAVLGLMQVMKHLENIGDVGRGIATAFVATVYGVGSANLLFLPAASKIRARARQAARARELIIEGVLAIAEGLNPALIRTRLGAYLDGVEPSAPVKAATPAANAAAQ